MLPEYLVALYLQPGARTTKRREREHMPLPEKVRQVIERQRFVYPLLARRRALELWGRPWELES